MNDDTNGYGTSESSPGTDDTALFNATVAGDAPVAEALAEPVIAPAAEPRPEPAIPPARLREEADARRAAERDRDELKHRLYRLVTPIHEQLFQQRQGVSRLLAEEKHGSDTVRAAYNALGQAMQADPAVQTDYLRIMRSNHPYGELVTWHKKRQAFDEIGSDPAAYRNRVLDEAMRDPEVQQRFLAQLRGGARHTFETPRRSAVPHIPSLQGIGTAAGPASAAGDASDAELFSATTRRRR